MENKRIITHAIDSALACALVSQLIERSPANMRSWSISLQLKVWKRTDDVDGYNR